MMDDTQTHQLPDWMRRARRGVDWGILLVLVMGVTVSAPFIFNLGLPHTNANENYVYRTSDYAAAMLEGRLYPHWSANVLGGYGAPIPSFYPPLPAYAAALIQVLVTNDPVAAVRFIYVISICGGAVGVYTLVLRRSGAQSGILAAALYLNSPFIRLVAPHIQGDLPTGIVLALIPTLLWATDRLMTAYHPQDILLVAVVSGALCVTSVRGAVPGLLAAFLVALWYKRRFRVASLRILFMSLTLGIGLAGFYWIPALLEQPAISWQTLISAEPFRLTLSELFSPFNTIDPAEMVSSPQFTLGTAGILCMMASTAVALYRRILTLETLFLGMAGLFALIAVIFFADEVWLTGIISLFVAIGSSQLLGARNWLPPTWRRLVIPMILVFLWIGSLSVWNTPTHNEEFGATDPATQIRYEQSGFGSAILPPGQPIPSSLSPDLPMNRFLIDSYNTGSVNKLAGDQINAAFQASLLSHETHSDHFQVRRISVPMTLTIMTAYFPGWAASLNDQPLALRPAPRTGLTEIDLPALGGGNNELVITLGSTDVRDGAWIISLLMLTITVIITMGRYRRRPAPFEDQKLLNPAESRLIALPILSFLLVAIATSAGIVRFTPYVRPGIGLDSSFITQSRTDAGLILTGFQMRSNVYQPGDTLDLNLFWQAQRFLSENYRVSLRLVNNQDESQWNEQPLRHPGYYPTRRWNTRQYVTDRYQLQLAENIVDGDYQIQISAYECGAVASCSDGTELTFFGSGGQIIGTTFTLPTLITIRR